MQLVIARVIAYVVCVFLCGIGSILLVNPQLATGPRGLPLLRGESRPMMAVLAAREIVLGLLAGGLAYTANFHGLLLAFLIALIITVVDAVALARTRSTMGFIVNDLVGVALLFAIYQLWKALGGL